MRRIGRIGVPVVAALSAVLISTLGASAATATPNHLLPPLRCVQRVQPDPGSQVPTVSQNGGSGGVVVTKPGPGKPGQPGMCVVCGMQVTVGSGKVMPLQKPDKGKCVVCIVRIGDGHGKRVTSGGGGTVSVPGPGGDKPGPVTIGQGGGGVVTGGPGPFCPAPPQSGSAHR
jgi:hypothetical protein